MKRREGVRAARRLAKEHLSWHSISAANAIDSEAFADRLEQWPHGLGRVLS